MTNTISRAWEDKRTAETRQVEDVLRRVGFQQVDAYRYNTASIRVRVIDSRFEGSRVQIGMRWSSLTWRAYRSGPRRTSRTCSPSPRQNSNKLPRRSRSSF